MIRWLRERHALQRLQNAEFLVADWVSSGIVISLVSGTDQKVLRSAFHSWLADLNPFENPVAAGNLLKQITTEACFPTNVVVVSVPRRDVAVRFSEFPALPEQELRAAAELQAESRAQAAGHSLRWDIIRHQLPAGSDISQVMFVSVPQSVTDSIGKAAEIAGWEVPILTCGDLCIPALTVEGSQQPSELHLILHVNRCKRELLLCHGDVPVSVSTGLSGSSVSAAESESQSAESDRKGATELSQANQFAEQFLASRLRMVAGLPDFFRNRTVASKISILGSAADEAEQSLRNAGIETEVLCRDDQTPRALAILRAIRTSRVINLLTPGTSEVLRSRRRRQVAKVAVMVACGLLVAIAAIQFHRISLQDSLQNLTKTNEQLTQFVDRGQSNVQEWTYVANWSQNSVNVAREIRNLGAAISSGENVILTRLQLDNQVDSDSTVFRIDGLAKSPEDAIRVTRALLDRTDLYEVRPHGIEPAPEGSVLPVQFRLEAMLRVPSGGKEDQP
jgi:hypothetical protein